MKLLGRSVVLWPLLLVMLLGASFSARSQDLVAFIEESRSVPRGLEWNREIVAFGGGWLPCRIKNRDGELTVILVADRSYRAITTGNRQGMVKEDLIFFRDVPSGEFEGRIKVPKAGNYWFILKNESAVQSLISLTCYKEGGQ